mgnify:CR=1 FL=1
MMNSRGHEKKFGVRARTNAEWDAVRTMIHATEICQESVRGDIFCLCSCVFVSLMSLTHVWTGIRNPVLETADIAK